MLYGGRVTIDCVGTCGTLFAIDPATNAETVLHEFRGGHDGIEPRGGLIEAGGTLFGITYGVYNCHNVCGTVYAYTP